MLSDHRQDSDGWLHLRVSKEKGGGNAGMTLRGGQREFSFENLGPSTNRAQVFGSGFLSEEITFVLGAQGDRNLILRF